MDDENTERLIDSLESIEKSLKELINALNEKLKPHLKKNESIRNAWIMDNGHMKIRTVIDFNWKRKSISKTTEIFARMAKNAVEAKYNEMKTPFDRWVKA